MRTGHSYALVVISCHLVYDFNIESWILEIILKDLFTE